MKAGTAMAQVAGIEVGLMLMAMLGIGGIVFAALFNLAGNAFIGAGIQALLTCIQKN